MHADLVVTDANLLTMNDRQPAARAMAVRRGIIEAVGDDAAILALAGPDTVRIDAGGKTIVPGFHDCHLHLLWAGLSMVAEADLVGCASIDDVVDRLARFAETSPGDGWITGHGFDQEKLADRRMPTRADLDRVSANRPILISRVCGHAAIVNSAALALVDDRARRAGDADSGLYTENDIDAFRSLVPPHDDATCERALLHAMNVALRTGITSVQTLLDTPGQMRTYQRLRQRLGRLPIRVVAIPPESSADTLHAHGITTGFGDAWLRIGGAKFFSDGSLGARTALLAEPYADAPDAGVGLRIYPRDALISRATRVASMGFPIVVHAIGDEALRETLDAIEAAGPSRNGRHRVEHASLCPPDCIERLARLDVMVTLQPQFVTSDTWTGERLGPARARWAYPFRDLIDAGVTVGLSSDAPVETIDAFACLAAAVGRAAWSPAGGLTPTEATRAYTLGSAALGHRDHELGSLEVGKLADFVVLSDDPTTLDADAIRSLRAERVFVDGKDVDRAM